MSVFVPEALLLDEATGEYGVTDAATSGGDIGAQVPIFPVVWVRAACSALTESRQANATDCVLMAYSWQVKGIKDFHGGRAESIILSNVTVEKGWVTTSSARRSWLFVQFDKDMDDNGRDLYKRLNNLGECIDCIDSPPLLVCVRASCPTLIPCASCVGLDFPDAHLRAPSHDDVVERLLEQLRTGTFTGTKPKKGTFSSMFPARDDGHLLASFILQQPQVLSAFASADPHSLDGYARAPPC